MPHIKRSNYELKKQAEWWLVMSQVILGSTVIKLLEPQSPEANIKTLITALGGLFLALICVRFGLKTARGVVE